MGIINSKLNTSTFPVTGMMCAVCANAVEKTLNDSPGVTEATVNFAASTATIRWNPDETSPERLAERIRSAGYAMIVEPSEEEAMKIQEEEEMRLYRSIRTKVIAAWTLTLPLVIICMGNINFPASSWVMCGLTLSVMLFCGHQFYTKGFLNLLHRQPSMESLVAVSTAVSFLFSLFNTIFPSYWESRSLSAGLYYEGAAMIVAFVLTGKMMEIRARHSTGSALRALMSLAPDEANKKLPDGEVVKVPASTLTPGDILVIRPGERIPADGIVTEGFTSIDESMLTGEPLPVERQPGDHIAAGTINGLGTVEMKALKVGNDTELSRIVRSVRDAQGSKAPVQKLVDRISRLFVPGVIIISILTLVVWLLSGPERLPMAILASVSVLVIACPCALGLATPTAIMVGIGKGARMGILIKDAAALETLSKTDILCLDKTGTLTEGKPEVLIEAGENFIDETDIFLSLELKSEHPLAQAVARRCQELGATPAEVTEFRYIPGKGVTGKYGTDIYWVGNHSLAETIGAAIPENVANASKEWLKEGAGVVLAGNNKQATVAFKISDSLRPGVKEAICKIKEMGIIPVLLTGDRFPTALHIASLSGIDRVEAELSPDGKARFIENLKQKGKRVAMAGDGINDSEALALADVSIAMGTGSEIAIETAQLTLTKADIRGIPLAVSLSAATRRIIKQNLFWAFIYNIAGIPLAAGALYPLGGFMLNPMAASAAMAISSVCVVTNSLRLRTIPPHLRQIQ